MPVKVFSGRLTKAHETDAGYDLYADGNYIIPPKKSTLVGTGVRLAIPNGVVGKIEARSGLSVKHNIEVGAGVVDPGYRGEVKVHLYNHGDNVMRINEGDRIAQILFVKLEETDVIFTNEEDETDRGSNGFGSTGIGGINEGVNKQS